MSSPGISEAPSRAVEPPPPPPPPVPGQVPALRISTANELAAPRKGPTQEGYEPPAAIQNAMMTKDKKPFTYTPGMGGKLDLSQIRSPRMARRVAKNANDEGVEGPPKSSFPQEPKSPASNIYSHPQVAVAVFPQQPVANLRSALSRPSAVIERVESVPKPVVKVETKIVPMVNSPDIPTSPTSPTSPTQVTLAKAPTPWMQKQVKQQEELPEWAKRSSNKPQELDSQAKTVQIERVPPPPRIEDRPSIFSAINEPGHHQLINTTPHHQSRWGNPVGMSCATPQQQAAAFVVPVQISSQHPYQISSAKLTAIDNQNNKNMSRAYGNQSQPVEPGPVQSKSFRVLQKITDTDPEQIEPEQLRKLQLTEDDRCLMNKFKEQVDGDTYLHQEEDPRYRGATIPSRAFRYLQNITESGELPSANNMPRPVNSVDKNQNRNSKNYEEPQTYLPPSEQQAPEPKKYMGAAIPSRSFRILQAMTAPENIGLLKSTITGNTEPPDVRVLSESGSLEDNSERTCSFNDNIEEIASSQSSDSSCDSDSYLAYSTGLNPLQKQLLHNHLDAKTEAHEDNSTDCDQQDIGDDSDEDDNDEGDDDDGDDCDDDSKDNRIGDEHQRKKAEKKKEETKECAGIKGEGKESAENVDMDQNETQANEKGKIGKREEESDELEKYEGEGGKETEKMVGEEEEAEKEGLEHREESCATHVSVRLPLRINEKKEKMTIDTSVDFTLKRTSSNENPRFIVTSTDNLNEEENEDDEEKKVESVYSPCTATTSLLSVPQENSSRDEVTDDEDSGVTSDMSRIISEVDTDSECCLRVKAQYQNKKYQRTQTHSRLFRLLNQEQLKPPAPEGNSSNSSGLTSPDCSLSHDYATLGQQLPTRPKSLDCEALFKRYSEKQQNVSYYQNWKNAEQEHRERQAEKSPMLMYPRSNVLCPRVKNARSLSLVKNCPNGSTDKIINTVSSNIILPSIRTNRHC